MTMSKISDVLDLLRVRFARADETADRIAEDVLEVKQGLTAFEIQLGRPGRDRTDARRHDHAAIRSAGSDVGSNPTQVEPHRGSRVIQCGPAPHPAAAD
jgi:hypothetical protein